MIRQPHGYLFGDFEVAPEAAELRRAGGVVHLEPKVLQLLVYLIEHRERLVPKRELLEAVWDEQFVTENALTKAIGRLRKALEDDAQNPRYIHTHHTLGYRFVAEVEERRASALVDSGPEQSDDASRRGPGRKVVLAVGGSVALVVVALLAFFARGAGRDGLRQSETPPEIRSLAVLPLANLTGDPEQDYFVEGIHEALITDISKIASLRVISRQSVMRFKESEETAPEIARRLGVDALVEGSVMREQDRVGLWAQLIDGPSDRHLWAQSYEREVPDVLGMVNELARTISGEIRVTLTPEQDRLPASVRSVDPEAQEIHFRARYHFNQFTLPGLVKARELFRAALDLDPTFAPAHTGVGATYLLAAMRGTPPREVMPAARAAALEAIGLDDGLAEAYTLLGWVRLNFDWDWPGAAEALRRALELNPSDPLAHHAYGDYLTVMGRPEEGLEHVLRGRECDPLSPITHAPVLHHLSMLRRHDEVITESRRALGLFPGLHGPRWRLAWALLEQGRHDEAEAEFSKVTDPDDPEVGEARAQGFAVSGLRGARRSIAELLARRAESGYVDPRRIAAHYAAGGDADAALAWLEKSYEERSPHLVLINANPDFDSVRSDPRFQALVRRIGLPQSG